MNATMRSKVRVLSVTFMAAALLLAACAKNTTPSAGGTTGAPATTTATSVKIGTATVSGAGTVLVDPKGFTLYHLTTETPGKIVCTGACAGTWPPVLLPAGVAAATASMGLTGSNFGTIARPDGGTQVTYKGMPLYLYSGDTGPGQDNGQGIQNTWFAVTSSAGGGAPTPSGTQSSSGGGYGY